MPSSFSYASEKEPKIEKSPIQSQQPEVVESAQLGKREKIGKKKQTKHSPEVLSSSLSSSQSSEESHQIHALKKTMKTQMKR
jgi:hypothetical protein